MSRGIVIVGGGYAGLAVALDLARAGLSVTLVSEKPSFLKLVFLQRAIHTEIDKISITFASLAERFRFSFREASLSFDEGRIDEWAARSCIPELDLPFDALILATGARPPRIEEKTAEQFRSAHILTEADFRAGIGRDRLSEFCEQTPGGALTVVGGGPTGIQFLFELSDYFRLRRIEPLLRLVTMDSRLLPAFSPRFHDITMDKAEARGIEVMLSSAFVRHLDRRIELGGARAAGDGRPDQKTANAIANLTVPSDLTLLCPGVAPTPVSLAADVHGRVIGKSGVHERVFAAGDCVQFDGAGLNSLSAQAAVRKGKLVAENVRHMLRKEQLERYNYREVGYFLSLGYWDGLGWIGWPENVLSGLPAFAVKEAVEAQFDLFVGGWDTYLNPFRFLPI